MDPTPPAPPADLVARIRAVLKEENPGEAEDLAALRRQETSAPHAEAFDALLRSGRCAPVDLMWALSYYEKAKRAAKTAIDEMRGINESIGTGFPCDKCGNTQTVVRPLQVSAGDEATKILVECLVPTCRHTLVMG